MGLTSIYDIIDLTNLFFCWKLKEETDVSMVSYRLILWLNVRDTPEIFQVERYFKCRACTGTIQNASTHASQAKKPQKKWISYVVLYHLFNLLISLSSFRRSRRRAILGSHNHKRESNSWLSQSQKRWKNEKPIAMGWLPFAGSAWQTNLHHPWARNEILRVLHNLRWPIMYVLCNCKIIVLTDAAPLDNDFSCCCLMCWFIMILDLQRPPPWQFFYMGRNQERTTILSTFNKVILYWCAARPSTFNLHQIRCHCSSSASLQHNNNATSLSYGRPSTSSWFQRRELVL